MNEPQQAKFEGWAVVEIFGHQRYAGYVTTEVYGQAVLFRVDVPPLEERERVAKHYEYAAGKDIPPGSTVKETAVQGYTKLFGAGAIYAITPCSQEAAVKAVAEMQSRKLTIVQLAPERALAGAVATESELWRLRSSKWPGHRRSRPPRRRRSSAGRPDRSAPRFRPASSSRRTWRTTPARRCAGSTRRRGSRCSTSTPPSTGC